MLNFGSRRFQRLMKNWHPLVLLFVVPILCGGCILFPGDRFVGVLQNSDDRTLLYASHLPRSIHVTDVLLCRSAGSGGKYDEDTVLWHVVAVRPVLARTFQFRLLIVPPDFVERITPSKAMDVWYVAVVRTSDGREYRNVISSQDVREAMQLRTRGA